jgi:hypothetical protein
MSAPAPTSFLASATASGLRILGLLRVVTGLAQCNFIENASEKLL